MLIVVPNNVEIFFMKIFLICTSFADLHGQFGQLPLQHRLLLLW